jgi:uncharacterized protein involved in exopolysaccharide biosynthesis
VVILSVAVVTTARTPPSFTSEAKIYVRIGKESVGLDPTATTGQFVPIQESRAQEINSVADLLRSQSVLAGVVDEIGTDAFVGGGPGLLASAGKILEPINLNPFRVHSAREAAIRQLANGLRVEYTRQSSIVTLTNEADSPELAQQVLECLIKVAREKHIRVNRTEGSRVFFEEQADLLRQALETAEQAMLAFKNEQSLADPDQQRQIYLEQIGKLQADLLQAQSERAAAEAEVLAMQRSIKGLDGGEFLETTSGMPLRAASDMRANLYALELKEKEYSSKYTEHHFLLKQIREQIAEARNALANELKDPQVIKGISESKGGLEQVIFQRTALAASLQAKVESLQQQLKETEQRMEQLNQNEVEFSRLQRAVDLAAANHLTYAEKLEQARIDEALWQDNISNINVLQEPTLSETPTSPRVKLNLAVGLFLAIVAALAFPISASGQPASRRPRPQPTQPSMVRAAADRVAEPTDAPEGQVERDPDNQYASTAPR